MLLRQAYLHAARFHYTTDTLLIVFSFKITKKSWTSANNLYILSLS
jgi:hypothetical protein